MKRGYKMVEQKKVGKIIVLFFIMMIILLLVTGLHSTEVDIHKLFLTIGNLTFTGILPILVGSVAIYTYFKNDLTNALIFSGGMMLYGLGSISIGILGYLGEGKNVVVTVYNICAFISSAFIMFSALQDDRIQQPKTIKISTINKIRLLLAAVVVIVVTLNYMSVNGLIPLFVDSNGFTSLRYMVLSMAVAFYFVSAILYWKQYRKQDHHEHFWYALSLMMISLGLFSVYAATDVGNLLGWVGRIAQYIGSGFAVLSVIVMFRKAKNVNLSPSGIMVDFFSDGEASYWNSIVKKKTEKLEYSNAELLTDLQYAKDMQKSLLPGIMPVNDSVSFDAEYLAAENLSGDFYNIINLDEENIAVYIGDVSGHGISAAMLTMFAYQNIVQVMETSAGEINDPGLVLKNIYKTFNKTNITDEKYIVMLYGIYNSKNKCFTYASAGINVSPYILKQSGTIIEMDAQGFPICKLGDMVSPYYDNRYIQLETGDKILFYSDGLVEAKDESGLVYGNDRLKRFLINNLDLNSIELKTALKKELYNHIGFQSDLMDDVTFVIMVIL